MTEKPRLFVGSSKEGLEVARAVEDNLAHDAEVTLWTQSVFEPSNYALEDLLRTLETSDFGAFVFTPDDVLKMRGKEHSVARDNVIFELGLFFGRLGRQRAFIISPSSARDLHLPSDLTGLTVIKYDDERSDGSLARALGTGCNSLRRRMQELGRVRPAAVIELPKSTVSVVFDGVDGAANMIGTAIGPMGRVVSIRGSDGTLLAARGASSIASGLQGEGLEALGIEQVRVLTREMDLRIGDGAKLAALLMRKMTAQGLASIDQGCTPQELVSGLMCAAESARNAVRASSRSVQDKADATLVARTAGLSNEVGDIIADAFERAGKDGLILVYEGATDRTMIESRDGLEIEYEVANEFREALGGTQPVLDGCFVLALEDSITVLEDILPVLEEVARAGKPMMLVGPKLSDEVRTTLLVNCQKGSLRCFPVEINTDSKAGRNLLDDVSLYTGGRVIGTRHGTTLRTALLRDLGKARINVSRDKVQLLDGGYAPDSLSRRADALRAEILSTTDEYQLELLRKRLAQLAGGVVHVIVGGATASTRFETRHGLESALHATYSAISFGMVPGGGRALLTAGESARSCMAASPSAEAGVAAVVAALEEPTRYLVRTTKANEDEVLAAMHADSRMCFDVRSAELVPIDKYIAWDSSDATARAIDMAAEHARQFLLTTSWGTLR